MVVNESTKLVACTSPSTQVSRARLFFRIKGEKYFYYNIGNAPTSCASFPLPMPAPEAVGKRIEYYIEFELEKSRLLRTPHYEPLVVMNANECPADR